jgi:two-component system sensor histidine kinase MprB
MKLSLRLTVVFGLLGLVTVSTVTVLSWWLAASEVRRSIDSELLSRAAIIEELQDPNFDPPPNRIPDQTVQALDVFGDEGGVQVFSATSFAYTESFFPLSPQATNELQPGDEPLVETVTSERGRYRTVTMAVDVGEVGLDIRYVALFREVTDEEAALTTLALRLAAAAGFGILLVSIGSWYVGRRLAAPLGELTSAAGRLADLDSAPGRIEIARGDEIGRLATSFNRMLSALEVGREQQRRLVADASHELRTPLTSLRMRTEFLAANQDLAVDQRQQFQQAAVAEVEHLSALVNDLIDLAADARAGDEKPVNTRIGEVVNDVTRRSRVALDRDLVVEVDETQATIRPGMIRRALQNLIDNADKYSPPGTPITIRANRGRIEVIDHGEGIPVEDVDYVFDRFFRSPKARTRPGNGIGLAIVAQVADAHRGTTWAGAGPSGGAIVGFSVSLD